MSESSTDSTSRRSASAGHDAAPQPRANDTSPDSSRTAPASNAAAAALVVNRLLAAGDAGTIAIPSAAMAVLGGAAPGARDLALTADNNHFVLRHVDGVAFARGDGDANDIDPNDIHQGQLGDCWFMASMAAVARTAPDTIRRLIVTRPDGRYDVTLHIPVKRVWNDRRGENDVTFRTVRVTMDSTFATYEQGKIASTLFGEAPAFAQESGDRSAGYFGTSVGSKPELWPMLLERAYAVYLGSYGAVSNDDVRGGKPGHPLEEGLELLTGRAGTSVDLEGLDQTAALRTLASFVQRRVAVTFCSKGRADVPASDKLSYDRHGVVGPHAYALQGVHLANRTVDLQNPWGHAHLPGLAVADLYKFFFYYSVTQGV